MIRPLRAPLGIGALLLFALLFQPDADRLGAATATPVIDQTIVATYRAGEIELTGVDLGGTSSARAILLDYGARSTSILSTSPLVELWDSTRIVASLPWEVVSGELRVIVDGKTSVSVELQVYEYEAFDIPVSQGTNDRPLAVAVDANGTAWLNQEFHRELKAMSKEGSYISLPIPQADGEGIFARSNPEEGRTRTSILGEDIATDSRGRIWFTQGGASLYNGEFANASRVISHEPTTGLLNCYNLPKDNASVFGVLVDESRGMIWYSEGSFWNGNAISAFSIDSTLSSCMFDPYTETYPGGHCTVELTNTCHLRFELPQPHSVPAHLLLDGDGNIWFTQFWGERIGRLNPETGEIVELPLPESIARVGPGTTVGSGPWELAFDSAGYLWVTEFFDASVLRVNPSLMETADCERLDSDGKNPCVEEVVVASDGTDNKTIHSLSIGPNDEIWFAVTQNEEDPSRAVGARLGFISQEHGNVPVYLPATDDFEWLTGIAHDSTGLETWVAGFQEQELYRITRTRAAVDGSSPGVCPAGGSELCPDLDSDGDGCTDAQELGVDERLGGRRDPHNFWDFYDTPNPSGERDGKVDLFNEMLSVVQRLGSHDNNGRAPLNRHSDPYAPLTSDPRTYHPAFDRSHPPDGAEPWDLGAPDGYIGMADLLGMLSQYGHSCAR